MSESPEQEESGEELFEHHRLVPTQAKPPSRDKFIINGGTLVEKPTGPPPSRDTCG